MTENRKNLKAEGVILGSKTLGETDKLVFIYTREHGKIKAIAKGAVKQTSRFGGSLETLNLCKFELYESHNRILITDVKVEKNFSTIQGNLQKITNGLLVTHLADKFLFEGETMPEIFDLIKETLEEIAKTKISSLLITTTFLIKFLDILGLLPNFKETKNFHTELTEKYKKLFNYIQKNSYDKIKRIHLTDKEIIELKEILKNLIETETEKPLKIPL